MKIKDLLLTTLFLIIAATAFSQAKAKTTNPDAIVKRLYAEQKAGTGPFFQMKNRATVDKYFRKDLANLIWRDAVDAMGAVGAIGFDPLYGGQDQQITNFVIMKTGWGGDHKFGGDDQAVVQVTFKNFGKEAMVSFQFERDKAKSWKIFDIRYPDGSLLKASLIRRDTENEPETSSGSGELQVGKNQSMILYVGEETGDYAAYCFANNSAAGRAILKVCKDGDQCEFTGKVDYVGDACEVPGLEATLSSSGRILTIATVKKVTRKRKP